VEGAARRGDLPAANWAPIFGSFARVGGDAADTKIVSLFASHPFAKRRERMGILFGGRPGRSPTNVTSVTSFTHYLFFPAFSLCYRFLYL
jgi:hypothetical protein